MLRFTVQKARIRMGCLNSAVGQGTSFLGQQFGILRKIQLMDWMKSCALYILVSVNVTV